jgi:hypothetical protein
LNKLRRAASVALIPAVFLSVLAVGGLKADAVGAAVRVSPVYDPPVLAGQMASFTWPEWCAGGVYGRHGDTIVLTSSGHCAPEGDTLYDPTDGSVDGVWGPISYAASCAHPGYRCTASDMNYLIVDPNRIPWGHLNEIDMGVGGYRVIAPGTTPLDCHDVRVGDEVEFDGRDFYRAGQVIGQREYLPPKSLDPIYFPCITLADIKAATGDSGGIVLVNGQLAGIASRRFGDLLGFTPLGSGLAELGVTLCDTPNCGLTPPE